MSLPDSAEYSRASEYNKSSTWLTRFDQYVGRNTSVKYCTSNDPRNSWYRIISVVPNFFRQGFHSSTNDVEFNRHSEFSEYVPVSGDMPISLLSEEISVPAGRIRYERQRCKVFVVSLIPYSTIFRTWHIWLFPGLCNGSQSRNLQILRCLATSNFHRAWRWSSET